MNSNLKNKIICRLFIFFVIIAAGIFSIGIYIYNIINKIPDNIYVQNNQETTLELNIPVTAQTKDATINFNRPVTFVAQKSGSYTFPVKLFGIFNIHDVNVNVVEPEYVYPGGFQVGLYLKTDGILAVDTQSITDIYGNQVNPCENIIRQGDYIMAVNKIKISSKKELMTYVKESGGKTITFSLMRGGMEFDVGITPVLDESGEYKIGLWVKDDAQGIGTLTFIDSNLCFGALGHGISDETTSGLLSIENGLLYKTRIVSIIKGSNGKPGELVGTIDYKGTDKIGEIKENRSCGIYGKLDKDLIKTYNLELMEVGVSSQVHKGTAFIRMYQGNEFKDYEIEVQNISYNGQKNLTFCVKSEELLELTNGIVQGMSGCPIIQDNKVIGAVTHVLVDDSTRGYGIFIEKMLG
jgi:stage IV sporulation protein B